ncbi:hypothetical protein GOP47_0030473 [Adiantum capillus-veneris]|nr:hypothetical protein GOP47_0030473 [Adiantum capillus-veneris]
MWFLPTKLLRVAHQLPCSASSYAAALSLVSIDVVICIDVAERAGSKVADRHSLRVRAGLRLLWRLQTSICFGYVQGSGGGCSVLVKSIYGSSFVKSAMSFASSRLQISC